MVKVVFVCTSATDLKGYPTGLWIEELAAPFYIFKEAGFDVQVSSIAGGPIPIDVESMGKDVKEYFTDLSKKFMHDPEAIHALSHSTKIADIDFGESGGIDVIYMCGGHGTCVDFADHVPLKAAIETMYATNKKVVAICHGPTSLVNCMQEDGKTPIVAGKKVTGFSDTEEEVVLKDFVPFLLESKLRELGGLYEKADNWGSKVCVDGNLVTGQNPQSSVECARTVVELFK